MADAVGAAQITGPAEQNIRKIVHGFDRTRIGLIGLVFTDFLWDYKDLFYKGSIPNVFPAKHAKHAKHKNMHTVFLSRISRVWRAIEKMFSSISPICVLF